MDNNDVFTEATRIKRNIHVKVENGKVRLHIIKQTNNNVSYCNTKEQLANSNSNNYVLLLASSRNELKSTKPKVIIAEATAHHNLNGKDLVKV